MPGYRKPMPVRGYANGGPPMEQLDSIMMTGGPSNVPMGTPGMGGPPPGPPMGGPPPGQDPMASLMGNEAALGGGGMDRGMEAPMSIEEDAGALAEAVIGRAEGDIGAAVAILDTAKEMLISSGGQDPVQMRWGGQVNPPMGSGPKPMLPPRPPPMPQESRVRRGPGYAGGGSIVSERDTQNMSPDEKDEYFSEIIRMRRGN